MVKYYKRRRPKTKTVVVEKIVRSSRRRRKYKKKRKDSQDKAYQKTLKLVRKYGNTLPLIEKAKKQLARFQVKQNKRFISFALAVKKNDPGFDAVAEVTVLRNQIQDHATELAKRPRLTFDAAMQV